MPRPRLQQPHPRRSRKTPDRPRTWRIPAEIRVDADGVQDRDHAARRRQAGLHLHERRARSSCASRWPAVQPRAATQSAIHGQGPFWATSTAPGRRPPKRRTATSPAGPSNVAWLRLKATPLAGTGARSATSPSSSASTREAALLPPPAVARPRSPWTTPRTTCSGDPSKDHTDRTAATDDHPSRRFAVSQTSDDGNHARRAIERPETTTFAFATVRPIPPEPECCHPARVLGRRPS